MSESPKTKLGAVVVNDIGQILVYTAQSTMHQCEENAVERWSQPVWDQLKAKGAKIAQCQIVLLD